MSGDQSTREHAAPAAGGRTFDADLNFLSRASGPLMLLARAMLAYIFVVAGIAYIGQYAGVVDYMQANGVDGRLLPLVILTELGGGLLVLVGLKTRWAAIALFGFCLLTAFILPSRRGSDDPLPQECRDGRRLPCARHLWPRRAGRWTPGAGEPSRDAGKRPSVRPRLPTTNRRFALRRPAAAAYREPFGVAYPRPRHVLKAPNVERRRQADQ